MSSKDCGHEEECERRLVIRQVLGAILAIIIIILFVILLIWLILRPTKPTFVLQDTTLYALNLTSPNLLTATFQATLSCRNPNDRIGIYYDRLDVYASYQNQQITLPTRLPPSYQGHKDITLWSPFLYGNSVPIAPYLGLNLQQAHNAGLVLINVKVDGRVRWKVGSWVSGTYHIWINCPAYITFGSKSNGVNVGASAIKYQLSSSCHVDV